MGSGAQWDGDRVAGPFAVLDRAGEALCCSARQVKSQADSRRKRALAAQFREACEAAGLITANHRIVTVDGKSRPRGKDSAHRDGLADMGHIIADENGGAFCLCNIVPQEGKGNRGQGNTETIIADTFPREAWAAAVRAILIRDMTKTKQARVAA